MIRVFEPLILTLQKMDSLSSHLDISSLNKDFLIATSSIDEVKEDKLTHTYLPSKKQNPLGNESPIS